jgi:hypothetical protein
VQRIAAIALAVGMTLGAASLAHAQDSADAERTAAARALFEEGMRAVDAREWTRAVDRLRRSLQLRPSPVVRFNLALACVEAGRFVEAGEHFRQVLREAEPNSEAHRLAEEGLAGLQGRTGMLRIDVSGARDTVEVQLDGQPVARALVGVAQPADPGVRRVSLHRDGEMLTSTQVTVRSGQPVTVTVEAPAPTVVAVLPPAPVIVRPGGVEEEPWFWVLLSTLVIGVGVGVALAIWASQPNEPFIVGDDGLTHMTLVEGTW